jgi:hypothetical protein
VSERASASMLDVVLTHFDVRERVSRRDRTRSNATLEAIEHAHDRRSNIEFLLEPRLGIRQQ